MLTLGKCENKLKKMTRQLIKCPHKSIKNVMHTLYNQVDLKFLNMLNCILSDSCVFQASVKDKMGSQTALFFHFLLFIFFTSCLFSYNFWIFALSVIEYYLSSPGTKMEHLFEISQMPKEIVGNEVIERKEKRRRRFLVKLNLYTLYIYIHTHI